MPPRYWISSLTHCYQGDLRLSGPPSGRGAGGGVQSFRSSDKPGQGSTEGLKPEPIHNKVISEQKRLCRSQGGLASHCATDARQLSDYQRVVRRRANVPIGTISPSDGRPNIDLRQPEYKLQT
ncbi:hypothetical protein PoB_001561500 [Plakobranchus ocellatus]|uniref:Uncharacterized protein n=1 Tax=Plakobranchus ocellatus TaxID=259542 RepID=A0AAV3Z3B7_9GAST|nr:hypothetical protein PoB_001561500 [Plakobranchus ocellatus]